MSDSNITSCHSCAEVFSPFQSDLVGAAWPAPSTWILEFAWDKLQPTLTWVGGFLSVPGRKGIRSTLFSKRFLTTWRLSAPKNSKSIALQAGKVSTCIYLWALDFFLHCFIACFILLTEFILRCRNAVSYILFSSVFYPVGWAVPSHYRHECWVLECFLYRGHWFVREPCQKSCGEYASPLVSSS